MDIYYSNPEFFGILMEEAPELLSSDMTDSELDNSCSEYIAVLERLNAERKLEV